MRSDFLHERTLRSLGKCWSQSLLNEVWFPSSRAIRNAFQRCRLSQSLLNEVWFPSKPDRGCMKPDRGVAIPSKWGLISFTVTLHSFRYPTLVSQSLLNEVWFPSTTTAAVAITRSAVAIPSKWGLISFLSGSICYRNTSGVAIPSKWGLISFSWKS